MTRLINPRTSGEIFYSPSLPLKGLGVKRGNLGSQAKCSRDGKKKGMKVFAELLAVVLIYGLHYNLAPNHPPGGNFGAAHGRLYLHHPTYTNQQ